MVGGVLGGTLAALTIMALEAITGLNSPVIDQRRHLSKFYWRWLGLLPQGESNRLAENLRIAQTYETLRRYLLQMAISLTPLAPFRRWMQRLIYRGERVVIDESLPETVRLLLQELGPTYVKLGQIIASRTEMLPQPWQAELSRLHSTVDPFPYPEAARLISQELGAPPDELFACFDRTPLAAASIGQVYRARLHSGQEVVVKVQRPDIDVTMRADFNVIRDGARLLEARLKLAHEFNLARVVNEFAENIVQELDFQNEAYNVHRLKHNMAVFPKVLIPHIYEEYTTGRVLTMEFVNGIKLTHLAALAGAAVDRTAVATTFMQTMLKQVLVDGFFHGDPHPGNVLVDPTTSSLIFLDMGLMGNLTIEQRLALTDVIWSLKERDANNLAHILLKMAPAFKEVNQAAFKRDLERLVNRYLVFSETLPSLATVLEELTALMHHHGLGADQAMTLAMKALVQSEQLIRLVAPHISMVDTAFGELLNLMKQDYAGQSVADTVKKQALSAAKDIIRHVPQLHEATLKWIEQYEKGRLTVYLATDEQFNRQLDRLGQRIERSASRLTMGLVMSGLIVGSALAGGVFQMPPRADPTAVLYTVTGIIAVGLVLHLFWIMRQKS